MAIYTNKSVSRYLTKSKNGWYTFRRKVPKDVRDKFGRTEVKKSLKTKEFNLALSAAARLFSEYDGQFNRIRELSGSINSVALSKTDTIIKANAIARDLGVHPDQAPILRAGASSDEKEEFERLEKEYLERVKNYYESADDADLLLDKRHRQISYEQGNYFSPEYQERYRQPDVSVLQEATYAVITGNQKALRSRTISDALEVYINDPKRRRGKTERQLKKMYSDKNRSLSRLSYFLGYGDLLRGFNTDIAQLTKSKMEDYYQHLIVEAQKNGTSFGTVNKTFGDVQAVITAAYSKWEIITPNPCADIVDKELAEEGANDRRSFRPEELEEYYSWVRKANEQLSLIGSIMIETGCRTNEATLLSNEDVRLKADVPHIKIRNNFLRRLDKKGLARDIPITGDLLERLIAYQRPTESEVPFFPRYGRSNSPETVSQNLRSIVRNKMKILDTTLVPYSTRHTFADRCNSALIFEPIKMYLMGHKNKYSTAIAEKYGDQKFPAQEILNAYQKQLAVSDWGDSGWDDEFLDL